MPKSAHLGFNGPAPDLSLTTAAGIMVTDDLRRVEFVDRVVQMGNGSLVKTHSTPSEIVALARGASAEQPSAALAVAAQ